MKKSTTKAKKTRFTFLKEHWIVIVGIISTFIGGVFLGPFMQAWFSKMLESKPIVYVMEEEFCAVPLGGTHYVFCKVCIRNDGEEGVIPISLHIEVNSPYIFEADVNRTYIDLDVGGIRAQQTKMVTFKVTNTAETVNHGHLRIDIRVENGQTYDYHSFEENW